MLPRFRCFHAVCCHVPLLSLPARLNAQDPSVSRLFRETPSEVPVQYTWRIEDLYPCVDAWNADRTLVRGLMAQIDERQRDWTTTSLRFRSLYSLTDSISMIGNRLFSYASHQSNVDMSNTTFRGHAGGVADDVRGVRGPPGLPQRRHSQDG